MNGRKKHQVISFINESKALGSLWISFQINCNQWKRFANAKSTVQVECDAMNSPSSTNFIAKRDVNCIALWKIYIVNNRKQLFVQHIKNIHGIENCAYVLYLSPTEFLPLSLFANTFHILVSRCAIERYPQCSRFVIKFNFEMVL